MTAGIERPAPRQTTRLLGHDEAEQAFLDAWRSGRVHHAWLLSGPRGIGKATLAFRIARFVLASSGSAGGLFDGGAVHARSLSIPDDHPASRQIGGGSHPDLLTVERSVNPQSGKLRGEITVDEVRGVSSFLALTTSTGAWRVIIVDAADEMNRNAANALLKRLEEPPSHTLFVLVAHRPGRLPATIRSRCRNLKMPPLGEDQVRALLATLAPGLSTDEAVAIARLSDGSIGHALALAEAGGLELYRELAGLMSETGELDIRAVHALAGKVGRNDARASFEILGQLVDRWVSSVILAAMRGSVPSDAVTARALFAHVQHCRGNLANWLEVWENVTRLFSRAEGANLDRRQVVINAFLTLNAVVRG